MQLRMTLAELGMSSVPSLMPIPRIAEALDEQGMRRRQGWMRRWRAFSTSFSGMSRRWPPSVPKGCRADPLRLYT